MNPLRPTEDELLNWLDTGAPQRIDRMLDDPEVERRLEELTALPERVAEVLRSIFAVPASSGDFHVSGRRRRRRCTARRWPSGSHRGTPGR